MHSYARVSNTHASAYTCVSKRARARRVGVRGSLARYKARTNNRAMADTAFPPQGTKAAIDRASTFCLCQGHPLSSAERSQIKKSAEGCTKGMTKAPVTVVAKALACVSAKVVVMQSKRP